MAIDRGSRLEQLLQQAETRLASVLTNALIAARAVLGLEAALERLIASGQSEEAIEQAIRAGVVRFADEYAAVFTLAGISTSAYMRDVLRIAVSFNSVNQRAVRAMQARRLDLISELSEQQRRAVRVALLAGVERGVNPRQQARELVRIIGLTPGLVRAVERYRNALERGSRSALRNTLRDRRFDSTVRRASGRGARPLTAEQIDRMVGRYSERLLYYRARTIAQTEALGAVHAGSEEMYSQAVDDGHLQAEELMREWRTARDERVRHSHRALHGMRRPHGEPFGVLMYPGDPAAPIEERIGCRCILITRIDFDGSESDLNNGINLRVN